MKLRNSVVFLLAIYLRRNKSINENSCLEQAKKKNKRRGLKILSGIQEYNGIMVLDNHVELGLVIGRSK